jgi:hypothetical protein
LKLWLAVPANPRAAFSPPVITLAVRHNDDAIATKNEKGSRVPTEIQFRGKTFVLYEAPSQAAGQ